MSKHNSTRHTSVIGLYEQIGNLFEYTNQQKKELENIARNKTLPTILRCAAIDQIGNVAGRQLSSLFYFLAQDLNEPEEIRVICHQWSRKFTSRSTSEFLAPTMRAKSAEATKSASDVLDRVRWLSTLSD